VLAISMGRIELVPDEITLIRTLVQVKADKVLADMGRSTAPTVYCGIRRFQLTTPSTIAYWDVNADIELVLRAGDQDREVKASGTRRTYWHPSGALLREATAEALARLALQVEKALRELLTGA
jgi:hypothetical protein